jgi:hypothetical protein
MRLSSEPAHFMSEDYEHLIALIRQAVLNDDGKQLGAVMSNNMNLIFAALQIAQQVTEESE